MGMSVAVVKFNFQSIDCFWCDAETTTLFGKTNSKINIHQIQTIDEGRKYKNIQL